MIFDKFFHYFCYFFIFSIQNPGNIAQKRKIELLEEQNEKLLKEMAALQEENNRLKKALGKRALNTIKNL